MSEHNGHDYEQNSFMGISPHMAEHLQNEVNSELTELGEMCQAMHQIENKAHRRTKRIHAHMRQCGECLSDQIKTGMLIELSEYWNMRKQAGGGRYPKLHYQVN